MSLNIKNESVHDAVRELSQRLGVTQTSAVEIAVREKLRELENPQQPDRSRRLRDAARAAQEAYRGVDLRHIEAELYDEASGLPR